MIYSSRSIRSVALGGLVALLSPFLFGCEEKPLCPDGQEYNSLLIDYTLPGKKISLARIEACTDKDGKTNSAEIRYLVEGVGGKPQHYSEIISGKEAQEVLDKAKKSFVEKVSPLKETPK